MHSLFTNPALYDGIPGIMRIVDKACTFSSEAFIEVVGSIHTNKCAAAMWRPLNGCVHPLERPCAGSV